jgi:hypothetical protein
MESNEKGDGAVALGAALKTDGQFMCGGIKRVASHVLF